MFVKLFSRAIAGLPSQCRVCHSWPTQAVCEDCVGQFAQPHPRCHTCALPLPLGAWAAERVAQVKEEPAQRAGDTEQNAQPPRRLGMAHCGACLKNPPPLDLCLASVAYGYPWSALIADFKFHNQSGMVRSFTALMQATPWVEPTLDAADVVMPMPLSALRLSERGYNQALLLARRLSPAKTRADVLLRIQDTPAQHTLKRQQRLSALDHAFAVDPLLAKLVNGARVVLVDDVMTTGASLHAAARVLRSAGASHITGLVLARTE